MRRRTTVAAAALTATLFAAPAAAQFGGFFGGPPPRPPGGIPGAGTQRPNAPAAPQGNYDSPPAYPPQSSYPPPQSNYPPAQGQYGNVPNGGYGGIQSRPLPPPGGGEPAPGAPDREPAVTAVPPGQSQPGGQMQGGQPPSQTEEAETEPPAPKIANNGALFSGLDKITGRIINFDVAIGETVQFGALQITPRACYTRPPTETTNTDAFVEVDEVTLQGEIKRIFTGWMFASSPGLHAVEHPIYDVWLTDCKGPIVTAEQPPAAASEAAPAPKPPQRTQPKRTNTRPQQAAPR
jgi:hypothetical protein